MWLKSNVLNRIDRISAILVQLQSKKVVKAQDIADRFDISLRTVYRDINTLEEAGVPIIGEAGTGYRIMEGYRLPPVMFTKEEATAFITAEKLIDKFTDANTVKRYKDAMYKVRSVLRTDEKGMLENIEDVIQVYKPKRHDEPSYMYDLLNSINTQLAITITYKANYTGETSERLVEPLGLYYIGNNWHLVAWCKLREDYRDFRLDRILSLKHTEQQFTKDKVSFNEYMHNYLTSNSLFKVKVLFSAKMRPFIQEQKYYFGFVSEEVADKDKIEVAFMTSALQPLARWLLSYGKDVEVLEPQELKNEVKKLVHELHEHYK